MSARQPLHARYLAAGERWSAALELQLDVAAWEPMLYDLARAAHPRAQWWWGLRSTAGWTEARCYVCDRRITSWPRHYPAPLGARVRIGRHRATHAGVREHAEGTGNDE